MRRLQWNGPSRELPAETEALRFQLKKPGWCGSVAVKSMRAGNYIQKLMIYVAEASHGRYALVGAKAQSEDRLSAVQAELDKTGALWLSNRRNSRSAFLLSGQRCRNVRPH